MLDFYFNLRTSVEVFGILVNGIWITRYFYYRNKI